MHLLQFGTGAANADMFRTDGNNAVVNQWQLFTGPNVNSTTQKFRLFNPANSVNTVLEARNPAAASSLIPMAPTSVPALTKMET